MRSLGRHPTNYELKQILKGLPEKVDFQTFLSLMGRQLFVNEAEAELVDSFKTFDPSNSGHISVQDLRKVKKLIAEINFLSFEFVFISFLKHLVFDKFCGEIE